jgi:hypothetical protein
MVFFTDFYGFLLTFTAFIAFLLTFTAFTAFTDFLKYQFQQFFKKHKTQVTKSIGQEILHFFLLPFPLSRCQRC